VVLSLGTVRGLGLSNAVVKLWNRFAVYAGGPQRPVYVVGVCERWCLRRWRFMTGASFLAAAWLAFVLRG
jgi:hypothetical protein